MPPTRGAPRGGGPGHSNTAHFRKAGRSRSRAARTPTRRSSMGILRRSGFCAAVLAGALIPLGLPVTGAQAVTQSPSAGRQSGRLPAQLADAPSVGVRSHAVAARSWLATARSQDAFGILNSVFCTSRANCWAVGERGFGSTVVNQMWHYNGTTWRKFSVPNPGGTTGADLNELFAVRCLNARDCWAVGEYRKRGARINLALHWNGTKWSNVATPAPGGSVRGDINELLIPPARRRGAAGPSGTSEQIPAPARRIRTRFCTGTARSGPERTSPIQLVSALTT